MSNEKTKNKKNTELPVLPVRDTVLFPHMVIPLIVGRGSSVIAVEKAEAEGKQILVVTQTDSAQNYVGSEDIYDTGTLCNVMNVVERPDGSIKVLVEGVARARVTNLTEGELCLTAETKTIPETNKMSDADLDALLYIAEKAFEGCVQMNKDIPHEALDDVLANDDPVAVFYLMASYVKLSVEQKQELLETDDFGVRLKKLCTLMQADLDFAEIDRRIAERIEKQMKEQQKKFYLGEQMKAIRAELGEDDGDEELEEFERRIEETELSEEAYKEAVKDLKRLKSMPPQSPESNVIRNYLGALLDVPWNTPSTLNDDIKHARDILEKDHYGMEEVKDKVIKHLAIQKRLARKGKEGDGDPSIICLDGPPGVGKTSICKSLAEATGRKYIRMALGGAGDESKLRGHRRTYIGAKPGEIIERMTRAGASNPLFVLDEIDKVGADSKGSKALENALLEALDPEQNHSFNDHYLEVDYDLSDVMFVATSNNWQNISGPLRDRMDIVFLNSYMPDEKLEIAKQHLVAKQMKATGLDDNEFSIEDGALRDLIDYYVRESGVRNLAREIKKLCTNVVMELDTKGASTVAITSENLEKYAGKRKYKDSVLDTTSKVGMTTGLAYTQVGGATLQIESVKLKREGQSVILTGNLRDIMKESSRVALSVAKKMAERLGYDKSLQDIAESTIHLHVPEGATPKDGPSAGGAMLTTLFSLITGNPVRGDIAMTGELNLRGQITAIGGLREKLSAAAALGYKTVLIPEKNVDDLDDVPEQVKEKLEIIPVSTADEVLKYALENGADLSAPSSENIGKADSYQKARIGFSPDVSLTRQ